MKAHRRAFTLRVRRTGLVGELPVHAHPAPCDPCGDGRDEALKETLLRDLNAIVSGPSIYDEKVFGDIRLREETQEMLQRDLQEVELERLNRLLLEDVFPKELGIRPETPE